MATSSSSPAKSTPRQGASSVRQVAQSLIFRRHDPITPMSHTSTPGPVTGRVSWSGDVLAWPPIRSSLFSPWTVRVDVVGTDKPRRTRQGARLNQTGACRDNLPLSHSTPLLSLPSSRLVYPPTPLP